MERRGRLLARAGAGAAGLLVAIWCVPRYGAVYVAGSSMMPALQAGDLAVYRRDAARVCERDLVLYEESGGAKVVHRVAAVMVDGSLRTKGDANQRCDPGRVGRSQVRGVVVGVVPCGKALQRVVSAVRWCYNHLPIANTRR